MKNEIILLDFQAKVLKICDNIVSIAMKRNHPDSCRTENSCCWEDYRTKQDVWALELQDELSNLCRSSTVIRESVDFSQMSEILCI